MIPKSITKVLTKIQRSQLRRARQEASDHLEKILRNVVKTVDRYYADQLSREMALPVERMTWDNGEMNGLLWPLTCSLRSQRQPTI